MNSKNFETFSPAMETISTRSSKHRGVGYCRYSTDHQTENSIAYQLNAIEKYCGFHGITLVNVYTDEAISGTGTARDGLQRMIADAKRNVYDCIIIYDQSRLSRNIIDWFELREILRMNEIQLFSCTESLDNNENSGMGFLSEGVRALFNHQFVLDTRSKVIAGQTSRAKEGVFLGGTPPLGYVIVDGKYIIEPVEADAVRFIFESYANGKGYGYIVDKLQDMGIKSKRNAPIGKNALFEIIRNERYIGIYSWMKKKQKYLQKWAGGKKNPDAVRIEGIIPPIIEKEVWKRVEKRISDQKNKAINTAKNEYLLSGLLFCGDCGGTLSGVTTTSKKGYKTRYYSCSGKNRLHICKAKNINADDLETLVVGQVERDILNSVIIERVADDILSVYKENCGDSSAICKEINSCKQGINNLLLAIAKGVDAELVMEEVDTLKIKKSTLELQLSKFVNEIPTRENILKVLQHDIDLLKQDRHENLKSVLRKYITSITINEESIIINCLGDLTPKKEEVLEHSSKTSNTYGCGGTQHSVFVFILPRPLPQRKVSA